MKLKSQEGERLQENKLIGFNTKKRLRPLSRPSQANNYKPLQALTPVHLNKILSENNWLPQYLAEVIERILPPIQIKPNNETLYVNTINPTMPPPSINRHIQIPNLSYNKGAFNKARPIS